jgi:uncharacterized protein YllA (UPF0747 family)
VKFKELPDIPRIWVDFIAGLDKISNFLDGPPDMQTLQTLVDRPGDQLRRDKFFLRSLESIHATHASCSRENIQRLLQPESVVVITTINADLFGGAALQFLKCLTTVKICAELAKRAVMAVPVCWVGGTRTPGVSYGSVNLLDPQAELHRLHVRRSDLSEFSPLDPLPADQISKILARVEEIGGGSFDPEVLESLRACYSAEATLASASAQFISVLFGEMGMVVVNPESPNLKPIVSQTLESLGGGAAIIEDLLQAREKELADAGYRGQAPECTFSYHLVQSHILPVIACVIDPQELYSFVRTLPAFDAFGVFKPIAWPGSSCTILDARSRRTLEKYNLDLSSFLGGEEGILGKVNDAPCPVSSKLDTLKVQVEQQMAELSPMALMSEDLARTRDSCMEKVVYQLERLRDRVNAADRNKKEVLRRHILRACHSLAPGGKMQEGGLSGIQFLLRYSRSLLSFLYTNLDIMKFEHQLIPMD